MQVLCCHSCMLLNMMSGIILWLVISRGFSSMHDNVECGRCREIIWSENRESKLRAKNLCVRFYGILALLCCQ
jgi:predicted nucleic acid-binding Zn ribbon protein